MDSTSNVVSAGTATVSQSSSRSIRSTRLPTLLSVRQSVSPNTTNGVEKLLCASRKNGKLSLVASADGSISKTTTKPWTANTWRVCGGHSSKCTRKDLYTVAPRSCLSQLLATQYSQTSKQALIIKTYPTQLLSLPSQPSKIHKLTSLPGQLLLGHCHQISPLQSTLLLSTSNSRT